MIPSPPSPSVSDDRACIACSYNLRGLPVDGRCPECGTPVENSLRGFLLAYASPAYLLSLRKGIFLILFAIVLTIVLIIVGTAFSIAASTLNWLPADIARLIVDSASVLATGVAVLGYWWFTAPDPGFVGSETASSARRVMRIAVVVQAVAEVAGLVLTMTGTLSVSTTGPVAVNVASILAIVAGLASLIAWVVQFFATMIYVRWLAARFPDHDLIRRTHTYIWLLPVLFTVGWAAIGLGPIVALVLYWLMLSKISQRIKDITFPPAVPAPAPL